VLLAVGFHATLSLGASTMKPPKRQVRVEMAVVRTPKPPPPPKPAPEPKPKPRVKPRRSPRPRVPRPPPPDMAPPPSNTAPDKTPPRAPVPIVTGISLASTVSSGVGMQVRVGNTLYGDIDKEEHVAPEQVQPYTGGFEPVRTHEITEEPEVIREIKASMPAEAMRAGIQGAVVLRVEVTCKGAVRGVRLVKGLGYGLDQAAVAAMRKYRFRPARRNGVPVDYTISRFYYVFELVS